VKAHLRLNEVYNERRNRDLKELREDEELLEKIQEWADNRGRIDEMTGHKNEILTTGSKFGSVGIKMSEIFSEPKLRKQPSKISE